MPARKLLLGDEAFKYAPDWAALREAREAAAKQNVLIGLSESGRSREAGRGQSRALGFALTGLTGARLRYGRI